MKEITVAVIGSGSTYCPELVDGFIKAQSSLKLKKISFMDIDELKKDNSRQPLPENAQKGRY